MGGNKANRMSTRLLMVILATADSAVLLTAVLRYWCIIMLNWDPRNDGAISCKLHVFAVAFSTDFAVGALCAIAVERLLVVAFPHRANNVVTVTSVILGMTSFGVLVGLKNAIHFWMMGLNKPMPNVDNRTVTDSNEHRNDKRYPLHCGSHPSYSTLFRIFVKSDMISFAVLPYIILFSSNVYIYLKLRKQQKVLKQTKNRSKLVPPTPVGKTKPIQTQMPTDRSTLSGQPCLSSTQPMARRAKRRPESAIKLLTALTLIHVGCTLPGTLFTFLTSYFPEYFQHMDKQTHEAIRVPLVMLIFTNNAINFFGYYASCVSFRESFKSLLTSLCRREQRNTGDNRRDESKNTSIFRCCCANEHSSQPGRVLIVAPKPCSVNNEDQMITCQQTYVLTEHIE
ncbi:G protein coupled receptor [Fasciola hepatica]|uniref:G protein coupled receptor n=1 Tax=Fasciola hepatica TaxID=6192 RepID=A0A4E0RS68_FASHE|nr:G protein coupled receptor [Fasciola hepatica]